VGRLLCALASIAGAMAQATGVLMVVRCCASFYDQQAAYIICIARTYAAQKYHGKYEVAYSSVSVGMLGIGGGDAMFRREIVERGGVPRYRGEALANDVARPFTNASNVLVSRLQDTVFTRNRDVQQELSELDYFNTSISSRRIPIQVFALHPKCSQTLDPSTLNSCSAPRAPNLNQTECS
jgi:hypothetical protein